MFENLSDRLQDVIHKIRGYGKITEDNISEMMREIRLSLLEAAKMGTYVHCRAGDKAALKKGPYAMLASDIIANIGEVMR